MSAITEKKQTIRIALAIILTLTALFYYYNVIYTPPMPTAFRGTYACKDGGNIPIYMSIDTYTGPYF